MFNSKQSDNKELEPRDIPGFAVDAFLGRAPAGESVMLHVVRNMEASQKIPVPLTTQVERPSLAPVQQQASITNLAEYRNARPVPTSMPHVESVSQLPIGNEQQPIVGPTSEPLTEAEAQVAMGQQALATINQLHDAANAKVRQFGQEWQVPVVEERKLSA